MAVKTPKNLERYRKLLLAEKQRLEKELEELVARTTRAGVADGVAELSSYEDHPADMASETFEREKDFALEENVEATLAKVKAALAKIEKGNYGICDLCSQPIKAARLQAMPFATLCVGCQSRLEVR